MSRDAIGATGSEGLEVSILVVSYNTREMTLACLASILDGGDTLTREVIVVDNDSRDGSAEAIAKRFPSVHLIRSEQNLGFAAANNRAAEIARGRFLLLLNPDTVVEKDAISRSVSWMESHPRAGALGVRTVDGDGRLNPTSCFGRVCLRGLLFEALGLSTLFRGSEFFNPEPIGNWDRRGTRAVGVVTGCYLMIPNALWAQLGGFDERFFMYSEDTDLAERVREAGYETWHFGDVEIVHFGGGSEPVRSEKLIRVFTAKAQFLRKHWSPFEAWLGCRLLTLMVATRVAAFSVVAWLTGRRTPQRETWREIWRARSAWRREPDRPRWVNGAAHSRLPERVKRSRTGVPRLAYRWLRFAVQAARRGDWDFVANALRAEWALATLWFAEATSPANGTTGVACNICTWGGPRFYPNTGPGYNELDTLCPGCNGLDRHRSLVALLSAQSDFFTADNRVIEVAPMRGFQAMCVAHPGLSYTSIDPSRHAIERGDITRMRFADDEADFFVCFHVLEHIPAEKEALREIHRVLKPGGSLVIQVPVDRTLETTLEYEAADPRDVGHVRRYGRDFADRIAKAGFEVTGRSAREIVSAEDFSRHGLSAQPIFFARKRST